MNYKKWMNITKNWRDAICFLFFLILIVIFLFYQTFESMVSIWWRSETFTHGFLVPPIVLWLIWRKRALFLNEKPTANFPSLLIVAFLGFFWLMGDLASVNSVTQVAAVGLIVLVFPTVLGWRITKIIMFPLLFLFFSVPLGEFLLPVFMEWTANFTIFALRFSGIPVYREGLQFVIPSGNWSVVEACSGIRYLIASVTVGTLFAYLNFNSLSKRLIFICFSIVVPIFANWIRAYMIVMLGHFSGNTLAVGVDHLIYGWIFFGIVIMLMFLIGARWAEDPLFFKKTGISLKNNDSYFFSYRIFTATLFFIFFVSSCVIWKSFLENRSFSDVSNLKLSPVLNNEWVSSSDINVRWTPDFKNQSAEFNSLYEKNNSVVGVYFAYYEDQNYYKKMISSENSLISSGNKNFVKINSEIKNLKINFEEFSFREIELKGKGILNIDSSVNLLIWQLYWVDGKFTANEYLAKLYSALQKLVGDGDDSAIVVIYTVKKYGVDSDNVLNSFLKDNFSFLKNYLDSKNN